MNKKFQNEKLPLVDKIIKLNLNTIFISPSYLYLILDYCKKNNIRLHLKNIIIGTEKISKEKFKEAIEFFGPIIQEGYGMAEILPPLTLIGSKDYIKNNKINKTLLYSAGKSLSGVKIKITPDKRFKKIGRIAVKSKTISKSYLNNPELNREHYKNNWFYSNDYGYINNKSYLHVLGREEDIIKKNGKFIFRTEIEEILYKNKNILTCYVIQLNEKIIAFVSLKNQSNKLKSEEIIGFFRKKINKDFVPEKIIILKEMPLNASGKIDRVKLISLMKIFN